LAVDESSRGHCGDEVCTNPTYTYLKQSGEICFHEGESWIILYHRITECFSESSWFSLCFSSWAAIVSENQCRFYEISHKHHVLSF